VHEGPARISKFGSAVLQPGMILSNEPGYYKAGRYGIRIENLLLVEKRKTGIEKPLLGFETLTFAPIDLRLVMPKLMTPQEIAWLNDYHALVRKKIGPKLGAAERKWLARATAAIKA
jgi:Xaa-Pro aminopeptidase